MFPLLPAALAAGELYMPRIVFRASELISPRNPVIRIEPAIDCDGSKCRRTAYDDVGSLIDLPPHFHWIESQMGAGTRIYAHGGPLPEDVYEPWHQE